MCFLQKPPEDDIDIASLLPTVYMTSMGVTKPTQNTGLRTREDENHCHEGISNQQAGSQTVGWKIPHRYIYRSCAIYVGYPVLILWHVV